MNNKYVNTEKLESALSGIQNQVNRMKSAIENYSAQAPSLGESSFRADVESNLLNIKKYYQELLPNLEKMYTEITAVKEEYARRASDISASPLQ